MKTNCFKKRIIFYILSCLFLIPCIAFSGEFRVAPIRLDFDRGTKSGVITVVNEGGERLNVQMKAFEWSQSADGKDRYTETNDIIFFPRIMVLEKNEEKILRAGIKIPATTKEKTYRLFIEEIPEPKKAEGVNVAIAIRFGVPIFVKPLKEEVKGEIEKVELSKGVLNALIKNKGNTHFIINSIDVKGKNAKGEGIFSKELSGWYLLNGASRIYTLSIPQEVCKDLSKLDIEVKTERFNLNGKLDVDQAMCLP
ncbi:MAG: fimbria/pilus periplasmic chaperone [Thermodesulfobacteriota bacterium]